MNEIVKVEDTASGMLAAIERMSEKADPETLSKLLDVQMRVMAKQAEMEFNSAFTDMSQRLPRIIKKGSVGYREDKNNKSSAIIEAFKFATYEDIDAKIRPILQEFGFSLSFDTQERAGGGVVVTATLAHRNGHSRSSSIPVALDNSGGKNNIQGMGSSSSYGKRYAMCNILNIVTVGEDDDAEGAFVINDEQIEEIEQLILDSGTKPAAFLKLLKAETLSDIKQKDFARAVNSLKAKKLDKMMAAKASE
jgi:hypothetical protein